MTWEKIGLIAALSAVYALGYGYGYLRGRRNGIADWIAINTKASAINRMSDGIALLRELVTRCDYKVPSHWIERVKALLAESDTI